MKVVLISQNIIKWTNISIFLNHFNCIILNEEKKEKKVTMLRYIHIVMHL